MGGKQTSEYEIAGEVYKKMRVLGKGAYGKVYAMQHLRSDEIRVIKELNKGQILAEGQMAVDGNVAERGILSSLYYCPYIARAYAANQDRKFLYIMLEYCEGGELAFHLDTKGTFSEEAIRIYAAMLCYSVHEMQTKYKIIHRDLKPENVLLSREGYLRIIDFNFAEVAADDSLSFPNEKKVCAGTMPYIAPEILKQGPYDYRCDWYSLGVMLYELYTTKRPFGSHMKRKAQLRASTKHKLGSVIDKEKKFSEASDEFVTFLCALCDPDPNSRLAGKAAMSHPFLKGIDWKKVAAQDLGDLIPFVPRTDQVNFAADANAADALGLDKPTVVKVMPGDHDQFVGWNWEAEDQELPETDDSQPNEKLRKKANKLLVDRKKGMPVGVSVGVNDK